MVVRTNIGSGFYDGNLHYTGNNGLNIFSRGMWGLARGGGWVGKKWGVMFAAFNGLFCGIHFQKKPFQYLSAPRDDYFQLMALQDLQAMSLWAKLVGLSYFGEKLIYKKQYNALDRICKL